tara:strand:+ start:377 stop:823 length:447 start_codon:yes stop_codon:yes gene_type:complete
MLKIYLGLLLLLINFNNLKADNEYFLTLRNDKVNLRLGPSFDYPIKLYYKKKFLPVLIIDSSGNFRKIKDHENNSGWIHISQLSKKKAVIVMNNELKMFKKPTLFSQPVAKLEKGKLCIVIRCKETWCKVKVNAVYGWVKNNNLWGRF